MTPTIRDSTLNADLDIYAVLMRVGMWLLTRNMNAGNNNLWLTYHRYYCLWETWNPSDRCAGKHVSSGNI